MAVDGHGRRPASGVAIGDGHERPGSARKQRLLPADRALMGASRRGPGPGLMARAIGLLARREHSRFEMARKLQRHLAPEQGSGDIERVLDDLQRQDLLSDERFAAALVRQRSPRYGDLRLARDLRDRGVAAGQAGAAMSLVTGSESQRAQAAWSRRFDALPTSADERGRQGRYLQTRGFSMDAITQVLAGKVEQED